MKLSWAARAAPWRCTRRAMSSRPGRYRSCDIAGFRSWLVPRGYATEVVPMSSRPAPPRARAS